VSEDGAALAFAIDIHAGRHVIRPSATMERPGTLVLFGRSGVGKTLTLRALAGLEQPTAGTIRQHGRVLYDGAAGVVLRPQERRVGYVPQHHALFPHLTVRGNVGFGVRGPEREARVAEVLDQLELRPLADRRPDALSGGERQRVAIARALAPRPEWLLLDEPFTSLDQEARAGVRSWFREHVRDRSLVVLLVTHDTTEAIEMGERLVLLDDGRTAAEGDPAAVLEDESRHRRTASAPTSR
jgi:ABC-type sulfate/molybdate transport systems ATPase subunit